MVPCIVPAVMGISQALLLPKLSPVFSSHGFFGNRSELLGLLPMKRTMLSSYALIRPDKMRTMLSSYALIRPDKISKTANRFCCQIPSSDVSPLENYEGCSSEDTLFSVDGRRELRKDTSTVRNIESTARAPCKGLGIVDFMKNKNFLITGATGFFAKVLIEKILRMQPDIGKLFLIIRASDSASALKRLMNEVMNTELFKGLRELHGSEFQKFMLERLVPVVGDMTQQNLGIDTEMAHILRQEVDIIISSAATTTFDERYDIALETNTKSVYRLLEFGKCCKNIQLFLHISTAYVNGKRQGRALEELFQMGYSIAKEKSESSPHLDVQDEFLSTNEVLEGFAVEFTNSQKCKFNNGLDPQMKIAQGMKDLGMERAKSHGWQDTYVFTKAMAEMILVENREDLPVVIIRPSIIESTYSQPFPGWIEGNRMLDPVITLYGKGQLSCFLGDPDTVLDLIPVDMVVNATLAAMAKHAANPGAWVYHVASSVANPIRVEEVFDILFEHFTCNPFIDRKGKPLRSPKKLILLNTMEDFYDRRALDTASNSLSNIVGLSASAKYMSSQLNYMAKIYEPYAFYKARFDISNSEKLFRELSENEQENFGFDVKNIQWKNYIGNIHVSGLRQHVLKERGTEKRLINI